MSACRDVYKVHHSTADGRYHLYSQYGMPTFETDGSHRVSQELATKLNHVYAAGYAQAQQDMREALGIQEPTT